MCPLTIENSPTEEGGGFGGGYRAGDGKGTGVELTDLAMVKLTEAEPRWSPGGTSRLHLGTN